MLRCRGKCSTTTTKNKLNVVTLSHTRLQRLNNFPTTLLRPLSSSTSLNFDSTSNRSTHYFSHQHYNHVAMNQTQKRHLFKRKKTKQETEESFPETNQPSFVASEELVSDAYSIPRPNRGLVYNNTSILSDKLAGHFFMLTNRIKHKYGMEVGFISVYMRNKDNPREFLHRLKDYWKLGGTKKQNGIMMMYVANIDRFYVALGEGLCFFMPKAERLALEREIESIIKTGKVFEAIETAFARIEAKISRNLETAKLGRLAPGFEKLRAKENRSHIRTLVTDNFFFFMAVLIALFILYSWFSFNLGSDDYSCLDCGGSLSTIAVCSPGFTNEDQVCQAFLNQGRKKELEMGACQHTIKHCQDCNHHLVIPKYLSNENLDLQHCSECNYKTVDRVHTIKKKPMWHEDGLEEVHGECQNCGKHHAYRVAIPAFKYNPPEDIQPATQYSRRDPEMMKMTPKGVVGPPGKRIPIGEFFFKIDKE